MSDQSPNTFVAWEPEPLRRGTFTIITTCLTTLGICVWSALHLSIPVYKLTKRENLGRKLFWSLLGIFLPELLIVIALQQLFSATDIRDEVNKILGFPVHKTWCQHLFCNAFAKSRQARTQEEDIEEYETPEGGSLPSQYPLPLTRERRATLGILDSNGKVGVKDASDQLVCRQHRWTTAHGFYVTMGGFAIGEQSPSGIVVRSDISPQSFLKLLEWQPNLIPNILPDISEEDIHDKGKSDPLAKVLLVVQVSWFCISCTSRLIQHLPLTLLEVATAAHALCSIVVCVVWLHKPLDVTDRTIISAPSVNVVGRDPSFYDIEDAMTAKVLGDETRSAIVITIVGVAYGLPHALAWNYDFATHTEQVLWRICTAIVIGAPCCLITLLRLLKLLDSVIPKTIAPGIASVLLIYCIGLVYFPANLYLIAASFRQLFYLPSCAFRLPVWSSYFPHVS